MKRKLAENIKKVEQRIEDACRKAGRDPREITLVAVTKAVSLDVIRSLVDLDLQHFGENRVQDLTKRAGMVNEFLSRRARDLAAGAKPRPEWHMVGHLQRNKVQMLIPWVSMIHSVDSLRLAEEIDAHASRLGRVTPVLLQVNISNESQKHGVAVAATLPLLEQIRSLEHIEIRGLMGMAQLTDDVEAVRHTFNRAKELFDEIVCERICGPNFRDMSMGMSNDFEHAIEFGATYIRVGSALYEGIELATSDVPA
ncbi:MAG: YggS family pyridoxal phosphate-dependent enzyme [Planctomycetota bacterium]|jgi:pyridoxal phosphate enzyme (YggS family)